MTNVDHEYNCKSQLELRIYNSIFLGPFTLLLSNGVGQLWWLSIYIFFSGARGMGTKDVSARVLKKNFYTDVTKI